MTGLKASKRAHQAGRTGPLRNPRHGPRHGEPSQPESDAPLESAGRARYRRVYRRSCRDDALEVLNLYRTSVTNAGLAKLQSLKQLTDLDVRYTRVTSNGLEALRAAVPRHSRALRRICRCASERALELAKPSGTTDEAIAAWVKALGGNTEMRGGHLVAVNLSSTTISDTQLQYLDDLSSLEKLDLQVTQIGDLGMEPVRKMAGLKQLNLSNTTVSDSGLAQLASLKHLQVLRLAGTLVQGSGLVAAQESQQSCTSWISPTRKSTTVRLRRSAQCPV